MKDDAQTFIESPGFVSIRSDSQVTEAVARVFRRAGGEEVRAQFLASEMEMGVRQGAPVSTVVTLLTGVKPSMRVRRYGDIESQYAFVQGEMVQGFVRLPEGRMYLQIVTESLCIQHAAKQITAQVLAQVEGQPLRVEVQITWSA